MFIDSHTHLYLEQFDDDRDIVVKRALENEVTRMLLPNIDSNTIEEMVGLEQSYPGTCYPMAGLHPGSVKEDFTEELNKIQEWIDKHSFIAIGEVGIDLYWDDTFRSEQVEAFRTQIHWAKDLKLPLVIHSRESFGEIFHIMDEEIDENLTGVFHSFTGGPREIGKILDYGFYFGINGIVTFKNSDLKEAVAEIPLEKLLIETDSPYLAPVPNRGKRNESSFLPFIAGKLAQIYDCSIEKIARVTCENAKKLFNLD